MNNQEVSYIEYGDANELYHTWINRFHAKKPKMDIEIIKAAASYMVMHP